MNDDVRGWLNDIDLSPDGRLLAVGSMAGIEFLDPEDLHRVRVVPPERFPVVRSARRVKWSRGGELLAVGLDGEWDNVLVYSYEKDEIVRVFKGHPDVVDQVEFSPDGRLLASFHMAEGRLALWDVASGSLAREWTYVHPYDGWFYPIWMAFNGDGSLLAVAYHGGLELRNVADGSVVKRILIGQQPFYGERGELLVPYLACGSGLFFSADGGTLLHVGDPEAIHWFAVPSLESLRRLPAEPLDIDPASCQCVLFLADRGVLIASSSVIDFVDLRRGTVIATLNGRRDHVPGGDVPGLDVTSDGRFLFSGHGQARVYKWRIDDLLAQEMRDE